MRSSWLASLATITLMACGQGWAADPGTDSLDFDAFAALCRAKSPRPAALLAELLAAQSALDQTLVMDGPQLSLDLSGAWASEHQEMTLPTGTVSFGDGTSADAALNLGWTVWSGGARQASEGVARSRLGARRADQAADSLALGHELRTVFLRALSASEALQASRIALARLERHLQDLTTRQAQGVLSEDAVLAARSRLLVARQELQARASEDQLVRLELGSLAGMASWAPRPVGNLESALAGLEAPARTLASLAALEERLGAARHLADQRRAALAPRVESNAAWHLGRPGVDPISNEWMGYGTVGLRLRWNLWDRGLSRARAHEADHDAQALEHRLSEARRQAALALLQAREQVEALRGQWELAVERAEVEGQRLSLMESRWRQGTVTGKDWLDVHDDVRLAEIERSLSAGRLRLAENRLLAAAGL